MNYIEEVKKHVRIDEGEKVLELFLVSVYLDVRTSNKILSRQLMIPLPLVTAIKNEYKKLGLVKQERGIQMTELGIKYIEEKLGYRDMKQRLYHVLNEDTHSVEEIFENEMATLESLFENRPLVDLSVDQAHCTPLTSLKRSLLALKHQTLIGKKILCVGDDDLVSVSLGFLLRKLYKDHHYGGTEIHVMDIDKRFLDYIQSIAVEYDLPIRCIHTDLRDGLKDEFINKYDCFYTDPPYTLEGMDLFMTRGLSALKMKKGLPIFLSFAHKSYDYMHGFITRLCELGVSIHHIMPRYNMYEGASILGNIGQMLVLHTTSYVNVKNNNYNGRLYTRDFREKKGIKEKEVRNV